MPPCRVQLGWEIHCVVMSAARAVEFVTWGRAGSSWPPFQDAQPGSGSDRTEGMTEGTCHHALLPPCCDTDDLWQVIMTLRQ